MKKPTTLARKKLVIAALEDIKAHDIVAIDVRKVTSMFDWIIVASADSSERRRCSGIATSFPSPLIDASVVRAVTSFAPLSAFSIVYSNVTLRDRASTRTVFTRTTSSYRAAA